MRIRLLREFITLAEMLNFTKAANKLYMTQPILSRHIKELEDKFGTELFDRSTHHVTLTSAGELLLQEAKKIVQQYDDSVFRINTFTGQNKNKLSIVYLGDAFSHLLADVLGAFKQVYPHVSVSHRDTDLLEAFNLLKSKEYDLGFVLRPAFIDNLSEEMLKEKSNFCTLPFANDPLCVAFNKSHPLAGCEHIRLQDISQYPIIVEDLKETPWAKMYSTDFLQMQNLPFSIYKVYPNIKTCAFELELNNNVVLLLPKHRRFILGANSRLMVLEDEQKYSYVMELIWHPQNGNPYLPRFIKKFTEIIKNGELPYLPDEF
ncbi:LysR family transcriptional regulator [Mesocricetibacter intestinalis]|uniref:LysR family transcriptional regulator n=1 Tax=Mesocricetibacter intestinalis TaxID=1521930 RepID=A0A4R6VGE2_9PAST|nr:LysR family transcriptional regulator [Mesocricetibacter intestinalis]TDQ56819.1 LysR family transcriptional regulator [Mesocricetibacter intestinalis]